MNLYTNKYPVTPMLTVKQDNTVDMEHTNFTIEAGKIFQIVGVSYQDIILLCEGTTIMVSGSIFNLAFTETTLDLS